VARVALLAESESHHPQMELEWGRAAFRTFTHTASGLSRNDFILAAKIDRLARG
jgi:4a-hydroxytetrahydrobiopterin dehydratase